MNNVSIQIANYKSIGDASQRFDKLCPVNLVIGRNNSGKSTLLDLVERFTKRTSRTHNQFGTTAKNPLYILKAH